MPAQIEDKQGQDLGQKGEEAQVQSTESHAQTQGTSTGIGVGRGTSGQDSQETNEEVEQREVVPQKIDTRSRPKWYTSPQSVILNR
jgi:hypothetical protein